MGCKYFCDRCGKEVIANGAKILINSYEDGEESSFVFHYLCEECLKKYKMIKDRLEHAKNFFSMTDDDIALMEYDFKVGDRVITSTGKVGIIESICDCDQCKARGFYEPSVETVDGVGSIYITDNDKRVGFRSFYQIGKYKFGNIDKESVEYDIENETRKIEEAIEDRTTFQIQLNRLDWIESVEETNKEDFYITFDKDGNLCGIPK